MQKLAHCFTTKSKIQNLVSLDNNLLYYTTKSEFIKIFSSYDNKILKNIHIQNYTYLDNDITISPDAKLLAYYNNYTINIISVQTQSIINTIETNQEIKALSFDSTSTYLFIGTKSGEIYHYRYNNPLKLSTLHIFLKSKYNFVNIIFTIDNKLLASDEYGNIILIDIYTYNKQEFKLHSGIKATAINIVNNDILIGDARGYLTFISYSQNKIIKNITTPFEKITQIINTPNKNYVLLNSNTYYITLLNTKNKRIQILKYIVFKNKVKSIAISQNKILYIALENNDIIHINIYNTQELSQYIENNNIDKAYKLIIDNPILENSIEHQFMESKYKSTYKEATLGFIQNDKTSFIRLKSIYRNIKSKSQEIDELEKAFKEYEHLKHLFKEEKYAICYALVEKFPPLKATLEYKKLEEKYKLSLLMAQHQMNTNKKDLAYEILKNYITINSKRAIIKSVLDTKNVFSSFEEIKDKKAKLDTNTLTFNQAYNHNDFKRCYEILDKNPKLNDLEVAKLLNQHFQSIIYKCDEFALNGNIKDIKYELQEFVKISTRKEKIGTLLRVSFLAKITILMKNNSFKEAENMIYSYIDIFGIESELTTIMEKFEKISSIKLAITEEHKIKKDKYSWYFEEYFNPKTFVEIER